MKTKRVFFMPFVFYAFFYKSLTFFYKDLERSASKKATLLSHWSDLQLDICGGGGLTVEQLSALFSAQAL